MIKRLEDLTVGVTYQCCNHSLTFNSMYLTPVEIDLEHRQIVYENAARVRVTTKFGCVFSEIYWFNFLNMHSL